MRGLTLILPRGSPESIGDEVDDDFHFPAECRRKGMEDWRLLGSPLLDSSHQDAHQSQAHLLDYAPDRGVAPITRFVLDTGEPSQRGVRD
jgi:hypothetical protein